MVQDSEDPQPEISNDDNNNASINTDETTSPQPRIKVTRTAGDQPIDDVFQLLRFSGYHQSLDKYALDFINEDLRHLDENDEKCELQAIATTMLDDEHKSFYQYYPILLSTKKIL